jgi:DNA adenine methylase
MDGENMQSPIKWIGGKRNLANTIVSMIPKHKTYIEPFAGAGWIFFKKEKANVEILNDINGDLINFYKIIKLMPDEFCNEYQLLPKSKELFENFVIQDVNNISDLERAVRFYYLLMLNFGGRFNRFTFTPRNDGIKQINFDKLPDTIKKAHNRLRDTYIERTDYKNIIKKWDKEDSFFFIDPPYLTTTENDYEESFDEYKYQELFELLSNLKGKFLLTTDDEPLLRDLFKHFYINDTEVFYSVSKERKRNHKELIITNYDINGGK